jgi:exosortase/archaeosortase family protein
MKKISKKFISILIRYSILIITAIPNFWIFYFIFTPLTLYPVYFLLNIFFSASLTGTTIFINNLPIELIPACIAGAAYYLLLILNLSVPSIKLKKRIKMILFSFTFLLALNILRIFSLSLILLSGNSLFDITHKLFWYLGSTVFVVGIWFIEVKLFKIKNIPIYSDIKFLYKKSILKK